MIDSLTQFELWELLFLARNALTTDLAFITSIVSAYLIVAYMVAEKLTKFQLITITSLYSAMFFFNCWGFFGTARLFFGVNNAIGNDVSIGLALPITAILFLAWAVSIGFMMQQRSSK
ncbi:MAG: hypothetical protein AB8B95_14305 [Pseudohongiellaceae bacterium]